MLELTVKTLPGEHARPLQQDLSRLSPDLARAANQAVSQVRGEERGRVNARVDESALEIQPAGGPR